MHTCMILSCLVCSGAGGDHDTTALCVRDSELVRMSKAAFTAISKDSPLAMIRYAGPLGQVSY